MGRWSSTFLILCGFFFFSNGHEFADSRKNEVNDVQFRYYYEESNFVSVKLRESLKLLNLPSFKPQYPTVFYIHGYNEDANHNSVAAVVSAYRDARPNANVILLDWSNMASGIYYINAAPNTKTVGEAVAYELKNLINAGLPLDKIHIIGYSLGAHVAGHIGRNLQKMNIKLPRLTGLDPIYDMFYYGLLAPITPSDARFVDIIHTDSGNYGAPVSTGTLDFWPNGGVGKQPGCPRFPIPLTEDALCSHWRSWRYWAESVRNSTAFLSVKASSYKEFQTMNIDNNTPREWMGIAASPAKFGDYFLMTNSEYPFGRGEKGIYYNKY